MSGIEHLDDLFLFRALMESTADSIYFKDRECRLLRVSRKMAMSLGFDDPAQLIGKTDSELYGEEFGRGTRLDDLRVMETGRSIVGLVESRQLGNGQMNWTLASKLPLRDSDGKVVGLVGITRDINEIRETEVALQRLATHDTLTELPNRFLATDRMNQLLHRSQRAGTPFAVLFMDIDRFKEINDIHGHEAGDELLRAAARRLARVTRKSDTVARLGGDEFVIIVETLNLGAGAETVAEKVERAFARAFLLQGTRVTVGVSIGISYYPANGMDTETLLRAADRAMYQAKREGGNRHRTCPPDMPHTGDLRHTA
jgi:diguanylate cyclase (GGDEF)-like protein/PAS domain S-box-containing protein